MYVLIITADDYGYSPRYDEGICEAAAAGALDSVSAMVLRPGLESGPLLATGVEIGLHLELAGDAGTPRADATERARAAKAIRSQIERFEKRFGRTSAYLDGHHHCHARAGLGVVVADIAQARGLPVRSIDPRQRRLLRCRGVATPDLLIGRLSESEPSLPAQLATGQLPAGVTEWMVHPGRPDPDSGSSYDAGRLEDLELLHSFSPPAGVRRATHRLALHAAGPGAGPLCE